MASNMIGQTKRVGEYLGWFIGKEWRKIPAVHSKMWSTQEK